MILGADFEGLGVNDRLSNGANSGVDPMGESMDRGRLMLARDDGAGASVRQQIACEGGRPLAEMLSRGALAQDGLRQLSREGLDVRVSDRQPMIGLAAGGCHGALDGV